MESHLSRAAGTSMQWSRVYVHVTWVLSTTLLPLTTHAHTAPRLPPGAEQWEHPMPLSFQANPVMMAMTAMVTRRQANKMLNENKCIFYKMLVFY